MNEKNHITALRITRLLDSASKDEFDRIVRLAANLLPTGIALISLIDSDRTWFKSRVGTNTLEISKEQSFCKQVIKNNHKREVMVVPNTHEDERFTGLYTTSNVPNIAFYAGAPLITRDGHTIGALCILDKTPKYNFSKADAQVLQDIAEIMMVQVEGLMQNQENYDLLLINEELQHRMGNMYTLISSLVSIMSRTSGNKALLAARLRNKILVLAKTQYLLAAHQWRSVPIQELVDTALAPFRISSNDKRITVNLSENFTVPARGAFILNLMLNELGTNSLKYGALKSKNGQVVLSCETGRRVKFIWQEKIEEEFEIGKNPKGFGTQILEKIVPMDLHGKAKYELSPTGLFYQVTAKPSRIYSK